MDHDMKRVRLVADGQVQGVFFRANVRDAAMERNMTGVVRNRADGKVEAELQGSPRDVTEMIEFCRAGPGNARVEDLEVTEIAIIDNESSFEVQ